MEKFSHEFDPLTGVTTQQGFQENKLIIHKSADLSANLAYADALRNSDEYSAEGIKRGFFHTMHIPETAQIKLMEIGIDIFRATPKQIAAGMRRIGYDRFITTRKRI
jgi:hypothetical protein